MGSISDIRKGVADVQDGLKFKVGQMVLWLIDSMRSSKARVTSCEGLAPPNPTPASACKWKGHTRKKAGMAVKSVFV